MKKKISLKHLGVRKRLFIILFLIVLLMAGCFTYIFITLRRQTYARLDTAAYQTAATLLEQASGKVDILDKVTSYLLQEHYQNNGNGSIFPYLSDYATSEETSAALSKTFTTATRKLFYLFPSLEGTISTPTTVIPSSSTAGTSPASPRPLSQRPPGGSMS